MKIATIGARVILGTIFLVFGLDGFFHFIPIPQPPEQAMKFLGGLMSAPYFFPVLKTLEILCGISILANFYNRLAMVILAPIAVNILLFHSFLAPAGLTMAIAIVILLGFLAYANRSAYTEVLSR